MEILGLFCSRSRRTCSECCITILLDLIVTIKLYHVWIMFFIFSPLKYYKLSGIENTISFPKLPFTLNIWLYGK